MTSVSYLVVDHRRIEVGVNQQCQTRWTIEKQVIDLVRNPTEIVVGVETRNKVLGDVIKTSPVFYE